MSVKGVAAPTWFRDNRDHVYSSASDEMSQATHKMNPKHKKTDHMILASAQSSSNEKLRPADYNA